MVQFRSSMVSCKKVRFICSAHDNVNFIAPVAPYFPDLGESVSGRLSAWTLEKMIVLSFRPHGGHKTSYLEAEVCACLFSEERLFNFVRLSVGSSANVAILGQIFLAAPIIPFNFN